jgi:hypothetical protein
VHYFYNIFYLALFGTDIHNLLMILCVVEAVISKIETLCINFHHSL